MSPSGSHLNPKDLEIPGKKKKKIAREIAVEAEKKIAEISDSNLIRNADHLLSKMDIGW